jgi:hypothetical protein
MSEKKELTQSNTKVVRQCIHCEQDNIYLILRRTMDDSEYTSELMNVPEGMSVVLVDTMNNSNTMHICGGCLNKDPSLRSIAKKLEYTKPFIAVNSLFVCANALLTSYNMFQGHDLASTAVNIGAMTIGAGVTYLTVKSREKYLRTLKKTF